MPAIIGYLVARGFSLAPFADCGALVLSPFHRIVLSDKGLEKSIIRPMTL